MRGPFKLRSGNTVPFKQMGSSALKQDITDTKLNKKVIAEAKEAESKLLTPDDLQASQDTIHQANIEFFNRKGGYGHDGNISKHHIKGIKKVQTNKNITTTGKELRAASSRSSKRIGDHKSTVINYGGYKQTPEAAKADIKKNIKHHTSEVKRKKVLKKGLKKFGPKPPTPEQTAKSKGTLKEKSNFWSIFGK